MQVPCNGCIGCRLMRSRNWAIRCMHEASLHTHNSFITLTYDPEHIPEDHGLCHQDFQKFMKRLRFHSQQKIRYYMAGEYGEGKDGSLGRPHYHAILFGLTFPDRYIWDKKRNHYRSEQLEKLWPYGFATIGDVTYNSARYVAQYCMKKITGDQAELHYRKVDPETGEIYQIRPEYNAMSRRPGIAYDWFHKYNTDVFPSDFIIQDGKKIRSPAYYTKLLEKNDPELHEMVKKHRKEKAVNNLSNNTPERLRVREQLQTASHSSTSNRSL